MSITQVPAEAVHQAAQHVEDILTYAFEHGPSAKILIVFDKDSPLAIGLTAAYREARPDSLFVEFDSADPDNVLAAIDALEAGDLVVLIQSTSFRLDAFRIRIELFSRRLKVIEHPHLVRMPGRQAELYLDALAYDPVYYRGVGNALKQRIDSATECVLHSRGDQLLFPAGFEVAKQNIGDYRKLPNSGGQYPIGEVFTESKDLEAVHGRVQISNFGDTAFTVNTPDQPITLVVEAGRIASTENSTPEFDRVLEAIRKLEDQVWLRELGLGLNRAFTPSRMVSDIGSYERMCGVHLSLGAKHPAFNKPQIRKRAARFHVDVFAITESVTIDGEEVFREGAWCVK
jgi:aminopeptidase